MVLFAVLLISFLFLLCQFCNFFLQFCFGRKGIFCFCSFFEGTDCCNGCTHFGQTVLYFIERFSGLLLCQLQLRFFRAPFGNVGPQLCFIFSSKLCFFFPDLFQQRFFHFPYFCFQQFFFVNRFFPLFHLLCPCLNDPFQSFPFFLFRKKLFFTYRNLIFLLLQSFFTFQCRQQLLLKPLFFFRFLLKSIPSVFSCLQLSCSGLLIFRRSF